MMMMMMMTMMMMMMMMMRNVGFPETFSGFPAGNDLSGRKRLVFPFRSLNFALFREK